MISDVLHIQIIAISVTMAFMIAAPFVGLYIQKKMNKKSE